jgi:hypothetical protein
LPWSRVAPGARAESPARPDLVGDLARDDRRHGFVHRLIAGAGDDRVGRQFAAVVEQDSGWRQRLDLDSAADADLAVDDQIRGADVDVIARAGAVGLHQQPGLVVAEIDGEAGTAQAVVEGRVAGLDDVVERPLALRQQRERRRGDDHVGLFGGDAAGQRLFRKDLEADLHQRV